MSEVPAPMIHSQTAGSLLLPQIHNSADSSPNVSPAGSSIESPISSPLKRIHSKSTISGLARLDEPQGTWCNGARCNYQSIDTRTRPVLEDTARKPTNPLLYEGEGRRGW
ncbi:uncharacterized protein LOC124413582 isoform X1 [Diprion similis]|uniref:uncharacterized protein LOC124413582 isoform X1 n=1 Tax=Diprion similis TaxID=362088 RepID=UPI001EF871A0|nr:uncharacterized protein LOC124413582 isoform X1 [Diprion similis]